MFVQFSIDLVVRVIAMMGHAVMTLGRKGESFGCVFYVGIFFAPGIIALLQSVVVSFGELDTFSLWINITGLLLMMVCTAVTVAQSYFALVKSNEEGSNHPWRAKWAAEAKMMNGRVLAIALLLMLPLLVMFGKYEILEALEEPWSALRRFFE